MDVICFSPQLKQLNKLNSEVLNHLPADDRIERYKTVENFTERLLQPKECNSIIIICVRNLAELENLSTQKDLFINTRVILVLPGADDKLTACAHKLSPRFLILEDEDFRMIGDVIQKMRISLFKSQDQTSTREGRKIINL